MSAAASLAELDLDADLAAALEVANAGRARAVKLLSRVVAAFDPCAMQPPHVVALLDEAKALLAEYGLDPDGARRSEMAAAYERWEARRR